MSNFRQHYNITMFNTDQEVWWGAHEQDLWIFDKLLLSARLGYDCGPVGVDVQHPGEYVIRPCVNTLGMGRGARIEYIEDETDRLGLGYFWCEKFEGRHLSVDYYYQQQELTVEGIRSKDKPLWMWDKWVKVDDEMPFPEFLKDLKGDYEYINVEYIGDKVIEVHLRPNPDWADHDSDEVVPVYFGDLPRQEGYRYEPAPEHIRKGFLIKE